MHVSQKGEYAKSVKPCRAAVNLMISTSKLDLASSCETKLISQYPDAVLPSRSFVMVLGHVGHQFSRSK
jgi:hypothetical protein